ncbi:MAG: hypothetical protein JST54_18085 [Deltaproteobacteria bacterium]|nr:hypothetical protein [Deltaproteobacteria bacterium]
MRRLAFIALAIVTSSCHRLNDLNVPPLRAYAEKLVAASSGSLKVERCAMLGQSRRGYCLGSGTPPAMQTFAAGLGLATQAQPDRIFGDLSCLTLDDFGARDDTAHVPKPGVLQLNPSKPLPPNTDNVHLVRVYAGPTSACVELEYPYG